MNAEFVNRVSTLARGGDLELAWAEVESAATTDPLAGALGRAIVFSMTGQPAAAIEPASRAVEMAPEDPVVLRVVAVCYLVAGRKDEAEAFARRAANRDTSTDSLYTLGKVLLESGEFVEAERAFQQVLEIEPTHFQALDGIGVARLRREDRPTALQYFARAFDAAPDDPTAIAHLREMYREAGWAFGAITLARVTRQGQHPSEVRVALDLMCLLLAHGLAGRFPGAGDVLEADQFVADLLESSADRRPAVQLQVARTLYDVQRADAAKAIVDRLERVAMSDEEKAHWHYLRGLLEDAEGRPEEALWHYEAALDRDPKRWDAACNAVNLLLQQESEEALARVPGILSKVPESFKRYRPQLLFNEAVYWKTIGRNEDAKALLRRVRALTQDSGPLADLARGVLKEVGDE